MFRLEGPRQSLAGSSQEPDDHLDAFPFGQLKAELAHGLEARPSHSD